MIIDEELRKKQVWVAARMKATERSATTVYFPAIPEANLGWLEVGDAPPEWNGVNPQNVTDQKMPDIDVACTARERLELSKEEVLQREIEKKERDLAKLKWELENPEKAAQREKEKDDTRIAASNLRKWFEFSCAIGGSWLKASTGPPKFDDPLHLLLVRDGKVIDVVKTTVARYCNWTTPEYRVAARGPGWNIDIPSLVGHQSSLFRDVQIGDCALLQIQPYYLRPEDAKEPISDFYTVESSKDKHHKMLIDLDVVKSQTLISALQLSTKNSYNTVYFQPLSEIKTEVTVGDKLWPSNPTPDASMWEKRDETFREHDRQRVLGSAEDQLKKRIEDLEKGLQEMKNLRDVPGRREELQDEIRKKNPFVWSDTSVALNGSWIKASTWPPDGEMPVEMLLLRDGQVKEIISTTLSKVSKFGPYRKGEYSGFGTALGTPHPGWGVAADMMTVSSVFSGGLEIGDCVMLKVPPLTCEGGKILT